MDWDSEQGAHRQSLERPVERASVAPIVSAYSMSAGGRCSDPKADNLRDLGRPGRPARSHDDIYDALVNAAAKFISERLGLRWDWSR